MRCGAAAARERQRGCVPDLWGGRAPLDRLALSPQCGFASTMEGNRIAPEEQRAKLHRVAETARSIWTD